MFCEYCGEELPNDAAFCPECGKPVGMVSQKTSCGKPNAFAQSRGVELPYADWSDEKKIEFIQDLESADVQELWRKARSLVLIDWISIIIFGVMFLVGIFFTPIYTLGLGGFIIISTIISLVRGYGFYKKALALVGDGTVTYRDYKKLKKSGTLKAWKAMAAARDTL
ncbi:MAG: zinc ribbon domain-containing protein [Clostridia bacterium]|nr:zinc ribbon domain-containing protein [Clostridia bacterium]